MSEHLTLIHEVEIRFRFILQLTTLFHLVCEFYFELKIFSNSCWRIYFTMRENFNNLWFQSLSNKFTGSYVRTENSKIYSDLFYNLQTCFILFLNFSNSCWRIYFTMREIFNNLWFQGCPNFLITWCIKTNPLPNCANVRMKSSRLIILVHSIIILAISL